MKRRPTFGAALIAGIFGVTLSVQDAVAQSTTDEMYQLVQVDGSDLPAVFEEDGQCREEIVSGTLTLAADGTWSLDILERDVCGDRIDEGREREDGRYTVAGDEITFLDEDGDPEDTDENKRPDIDDLISGTRDGDTLTVLLDDGRTQLVFRR